MLTVLVFAFIAYIIFRFVVNFVIPVYRTTSQVRQQFRNMQEMQRDANTPRPNPDTRAKSSGKEDDYIDFEEIK